MLASCDANQKYKVQDFSATDGVYQDLPGEVCSAVRDEASIAFPQRLELVLLT